MKPNALRTSLRTTPVALTAAAVLAGALLVAAPATAAPAAPAAPGATADCSVVDLTPETIAVGIGLKKHVTIDVGTDCDEDVDVNWYLTWNQAGATQAYTGPLLVNFKPFPGSKYTYVPNGDYTLDVSRYKYAGLYNVGIAAFIGKDSDNIDLPAATMPVTVLHRTTFGSSFNAGPEPRRRGQRMRVTAQLRYANWTTKAYEGVGEYVTLQFRPAGSDDYQDVKQVWNDGAEARTLVRVTKSGTWRYHYAGDPKNLTAPTNSKGDYVRVIR